MIDPVTHCPAVPAPGNGTAGHQQSERDARRDRSGTPSLKSLAAKVLARDTERDKARDTAQTAVPRSLPPVPLPVQAIPGVPASWSEGVALLTSMPAPATVDPARWAILGATAARLLRDHGAELHQAGWDALDLFGLNRHAPATYPPGWGLSWLLGRDGEVLEVTPDVVVVRHSPTGGRLAFRHSGTAARIGAVPAWAL